MLDNKALDVISRFKQAVMTLRTVDTVPFGLEFANRDTKRSIQTLSAASSNHNNLTPKVVEYNGTSRLVLTNRAIERSNNRNKRKWIETYGTNVSDVVLQGGKDSDSDQKSGKQQKLNNNNSSNGNNNVNKKKSGEENETKVDDNLEDVDDDKDYPELDSDDEESNPFEQLKLTEILAPLFHPLEIISHPAILKTYDLTIFNLLASDLIHLIEIEQENLNWLNKMLQVLNGEDWYYLLEENMGLPSYDHGLNQFDQDSSSNSNSNSNSNGATNIDKDTTESEDIKKEKESETSKKMTTRNSNDDLEVTDPFFGLPKTLKMYEKLQSQQLDEKDDEELAGIKEDLVNYLQVSIQRLHEYIKNLTQLRNGLVRSDRLKQDIRKWAKEMHEKKSN